LAGLSLLGAFTAIIGISLWVPALGTFERWVNAVSLSAAVVAIAVLANLAQGRREAIGRAKRRAHALNALHSRVGTLDLSLDELEEAAADLVLLEDVHALHHARLLAQAIGAPLETRALPQKRRSSGRRASGPLRKTARQAPPKRENEGKGGV
jgi:hypothetical protein